MAKEDEYRILTPSEYKALLAVPKRREQVHANFRIEVMMNTGARYTELRTFAQHPGWFDPKNRYIRLPAGYTKTGEGRDIHLTPQFSERLELYLTGNRLKFPARNNMAKDLRTWSLVVQCEGKMMTKFGENIYAPVPKTFRKTWETYLIFSQGNREKPGYTVEDVWRSQGHDGHISRKFYYQGASRLKSERDAVLELTKGWLQ